jgi:hypothetical protein
LHNVSLYRKEGAVSNVASLSKLCFNCVTNLTKPYIFAATFNKQLILIKYQMKQPSSGNAFQGGVSASAKAV